MVKIKKIQTLLGKSVDINLLKGVKFIDFKKQNRITKVVAKEFSQAKSKDKQKTIKCIVCGGKKLKLVTKVLSIEFIQCKNCSHVLRKYSYSTTFLKKFWKKKGDVINVHSHGKQQTYRSNYLSKPKVDKILEFYKFKKNSNWLDLGCGNGEFLAQVKKNKINPYGFDLNENDIRLAKNKRLNVFRTEIKGFAKINEKKLRLKFDIVSATGYFDVIGEPDYALKIVNKIMNKNGLLMIDVPNYESVTHEMIRMFPEESIRHLSAAQRSSFTIKSLKYLLKKNGYKIIFRWIYGLDLYMVMNYLTLRNKEIDNSKIMSVFTKRYNDFQKIFDEEKCSGTLFLIAKKIKG